MFGKGEKKKKLIVSEKGLDWGSLKEISPGAFQTRDNQNHVYGWGKDTSNH